jgi:hypothetical protein
MDQRRQILEETIAARTKALELLKSLTAAQAGSDPAAKDLYKRVTGQSSIENSIAATRRAVEAYDRVIAQLQSSETPEVKVNAAGAPGGTPMGSIGGAGTISPGARS